MAKNLIQLLRHPAALRTVTTAAAAAAATESPAARDTERLEPLHRRLSQGRVAETLDRWAVVRGKVTTPPLIRQVWALYKFRRFREALEVMDWIHKKDLSMTSGNHALYLDILSKVNGIASARKYFTSIPKTAKDHRTYGTLLYCYCRKRMQTEAIAVFMKMKKFNLPLDIYAYNNLLSLYMKLGQHDNVLGLFKEMEAADVSPDNCSYRILMKSHASKNEMESVERVVQEMEGGRVPLDSFSYCCLAEIYVSVGLVERAEIALKKAELVVGRRDFSSFSWIIRLYADVGNLVEVKKVWGSLKARTARPTSDLYLVMLRALRDLGDVGGLEQCFKEWKPSYARCDDREKLKKVIDSHLSKNAGERKVLEEKAEEDTESPLQEG